MLMWICLNIFWTNINKVDCSLLSFNHLFDIFRKKLKLKKWQVLMEMMVNKKSSFIFRLLFIKDLESISYNTEWTTDDKKWIPKWFERPSSLMIEPNPVELQESFKSTYLQNHFLIWNNVGSITRYSEQIQISLQDVFYHHSSGGSSLLVIILAVSQTGKFLCGLYQWWYW